MSQVQDVPEGSVMMVQQLVSMGISPDDAELAVRQTGADSVEAAIGWVFENRDRDELIGATEQSNLFKEYKMVFVVNCSLSMSPGKTAAQVAHAAISLYQDIVNKQDTFGGPLLQWNDQGSKKVVLAGEDTQQLTDLEKSSQNKGLPTSLIEDAGLTEIPPGSMTVLAIFGDKNDVDGVTGTLKLF